MTTIQLNGGDIHRDQGRRESLIRPCFHLPAGRTQHPITEAHHQSGLFGQWYEFGRRDEAECPVLPPHQGFEADELAARQIDLRLIVQAQLALIDGAPQVDFEPQALLGPEGHLRRGKTQAAPALRLGLIECGIGIALQGLGVPAVGGVERDPDTGADADAVAVEFEGLGEGLDDPLGHQIDTGQIGVSFDDEIEFIAANACHGVDLGQQRPQPLGDLDQQTVTHAVAKAFVHRLEVIEVQEQEGELCLVVFGLLDRVGEQFAEQGAIG